MGRKFWIFIVVLVVAVVAVGGGSYFLHNRETDPADDPHWSQAAEECDLATTDDERDQLARAYSAYQNGIGEPFDLGDTEYRVTSQDERTIGIRGEDGTWLCTVQRLAG